MELYKIQIHSLLNNKQLFNYYRSDIEGIENFDEILTFTEKYGKAKEVYMYGFKLDLTWFYDEYLKRKKNNPIRDVKLPIAGEISNFAK